MSGLPYVVSSCAMSLDGRIDDCSDQRLILSGPADLDRVDEVRAGCDAILIGAGTVRRDNPRLAVRDEGRRAARVAAGCPPTPIKVVLSGRGALDPCARLFVTDPVETIVYRRESDRETGGLLGERATIVDLPPRSDGPDRSAGPEIHVGDVLTDLRRRGVRRLLVEGGSAVHTAFLTAGLVDELHLVIAPFFVGEAAAPSFVTPGAFPHGAHAPLRLAEIRQLDDVVLLRYLASKPD